MRYRTIAVAVIPAILCASLYVAAKGNAEAGKAVFLKRCASCHGDTGEPKPTIVKALKVEMRHLGSKEVQAKSDDQLRKDFLEGTAKKKPVKGLKDDEVENIIAFVRTLKK